MIDFQYKLQYAPPPPITRKETLTGDLLQKLGSMGILLLLRDSNVKAGSAPPEILGMGMGVAAVWVMSGGVRLVFRSTCPLIGTTR